MVFTDVAGSTRLLEMLGTQAYRSALEEHRTVVRRAFALYEGYEVDTKATGDSSSYGKRILPGEKGNNN
jgi:class 3 adenylate cyclase